MADGARLEAWDHTAAIRAEIHNSQCAKRSDRREPRHFHPLRKNEREPASESIRDLKDIIKPNLGVFRRKAKKT